MAGPDHVRRSSASSITRTIGQPTLSTMRIEDAARTDRAPPKVHVKRPGLGVGHHPVSSVSIRNARKEIETAREPAHAQVAQVQNKRPAPLPIGADVSRELDAPPVMQNF